MKEGYPEDKVQPLHDGSRKWQMIKGREREVRGMEEDLMLERKQFMDERAASLKGQARWIKLKEEASPSPGSKSPRTTEKRRRRYE